MRKTDLNAVYFFDRSQLMAEATEPAEFPAGRHLYQSGHQLAGQIPTWGHRVQFRIEQKIDSLNTLVFNANGVLNQQDNLNDGVPGISGQQPSCQFHAIRQPVPAGCPLSTGSLIYRKNSERRIAAWAGQRLFSSTTPEQTGTVQHQ